jgi:hypothetical protein
LGGGIIRDGRSIPLASPRESRDAICLASTPFRASAARARLTDYLRFRHLPGVHPKNSAADSGVDNGPPTASKISASRGFTLQDRPDIAEPPW